MTRWVTVGDAMERAGQQIADDVIVDQALEILRAAEVDHLLVRGDDGRCAGLVTRAQLAPYLPRSWYTERTPLRDIVHDRGPFAWPEMTLLTAAVAMKARALGAWPVVDDDGYALGVLSRGRAEGRAF